MVKVEKGPNRSKIRFKKIIPLQVNKNAVHLTLPVHHGCDRPPGCRLRGGSAARQIGTGHI